MVRGYVRARLQTYGVCFSKQVICAPFAICTRFENGRLLYLCLVMHHVTHGTLETSTCTGYACLCQITIQTSGTPRGVWNPF